MKITERQLKRIIREEKARLTVEARTPEVRRKITDVDTGNVYNVTALPHAELGFITLRFGSSFTVHLDEDALNELYDLLHESEERMYARGDASL